MVTEVNIPTQSENAVVANIPRFNVENMFNALCFYVNGKELGV